MTRLIIENKEVELNESVQFAITKQFEELSNPTTIINDWSKTVSIPFSQKNNELFGHIYNPDKVIVAGGSSNTGIYFNPLRKLDFRLEWNNTILMQGYAKMNSIDVKKGTYELSLFGQLGKVFSEMQKITFDTSTTETGYLIDGSEYVDEHITRDLVKQSWESAGQTSSDLKKKSAAGYTVTDIIGFAPNNAFSEGFDYKTHEDVRDAKTYTFTDTLGNSFLEDTGIQPDTAIPNGLLPREIGEYRSYMQLPFIYWNKLFQVFQAKAESITGYTFDLDSEWFSISNPYWYDLVYMLKPLNVKEGNTIEDTYNVSTPNNDTGNCRWVVSGLTNELQTHKTVTLGYNSTVYEHESIVSPSSTTSQGIWNIPANTLMYIKLDMNAGIYDGQSTTSTHLVKDNALVVKFKAMNSGNVVTSTTFLVKTSDCTLSYDGAIVITDDGSTTYGSEDRFNFPITLQINNTSNSVLPITFQFEAFWLNNNWVTNGTGSSAGKAVSLDIRNVINSLYLKFPKNLFHSDSEFILNDLWNKEYNLFTEILKYCKMYRIGIFVDDLNKKIKFIPYVKYFADYSITDWTNKLDKSKDYKIKPITFENKYVLFNYEDSKTKLGEEYKEKYGINYGEYRLITDYNFNNETTKLFDKVSPSMTVTDNVLSWTNIYNSHKLVYSFPAEIYINNKDKDKKQVDVFGSWYFHCGLSMFSTESELRMRDVYLSDDTIFQKCNSTYCFIDVQTSTLSISPLARVTTYPKLDVVKGNNMCLFNVPMENYTYLNNYSGKSSIYDNFWVDYLDERYNIQNKVVTYYIYLKPEDYANFEFNKFIRIDNQLYMVNKIYDYDVSNVGTTKVDLITIQNIA